MGNWLGGGGEMGQTPWPLQNIPADAPVGISPHAVVGPNLDDGRNPIPFWDEDLATLDPSNASFSPWDIVILAGQQLPGLCAVHGKRAKRVDVKPVKGQNFATLTNQGLDVARLTITERIWTPQQLHALWIIMPILEETAVPGPTGALTSTSIVHPALTLRGISAVVVTGISILRPSSVKGCWEQDIECLEYVAVKKKADATGTYDSSTPYNQKTVTNQSRISTPAAPVLPGNDGVSSQPNGGVGK